MKTIHIGRSSQNDVVINDPSVSRFHCQIIQKDNGDFILYDTNSKNGTYVNGQRIHGQTIVQSNDIIRIGNSTLPWMKYFPHTGLGSDRISSIRTITIGRGARNDVVINDPYVSTFHCEISKDAHGRYIICDKDSRNGTFINEQKCDRPAELGRKDKVRIGQTEIPWQNYFGLTLFPNNDISPTPLPPNINVDPPFGGNDISKPEESATSWLAIIALILSIAGACLFIYAAIQFGKWGLFAALGGAINKIYVSLALSIISYIMACIADIKNNESQDAIEFAKWISGICIFAIVGGYIYVAYINPNYLNPFRF